jgi:hypothetical protein
MKQLTGKNHKFFERHIPVDAEMRSWAEEWYLHLKNKNPEKAGMLNYKKDVDSLVMQEFIESENILGQYHPIAYDILTKLADAMKEACEYYGLDPHKERYYVHSWLNYARGPRLIRNDDIHLDHHGDFSNRFHGYYSINADPSITYYELDEDNPEHPQGLWPVHNKNGRILLSLSGYDHGVYNWDSTEPRITLAYNIIPQTMIARSNNFDSVNFMQLIIN